MNAPLPSPPSATQTFVQRALGGHAALGLLAGALIYIIALTGSIIVIHDRWQRWEQPQVAESATLSSAAAQAAMAAVIAREAGKPRTTHLYVRMPTEDLPRAVVTTDNAAWYVDGAGRVVAREAHAWTEFVIGLHEYLHLPMIWGMILVGALGVALAALVVTGVLAHPRIIRDAFTLRTRHDPQIARADWHNRLGVWTLPFVLAVTLTGAFIGLGSVGVTALARGYTGGDLEKVYAPVFGHEPAANPAAAPLPDIAAALTAVHARVPAAFPTYVIAHDPGTRGQHVQVIAEHPRRLIYGETYTFDGTGRWHGAVGLSDGALGQQAAASAYNLHFGNYGGLPVEIAYMLLGLALCVITATGTTLWLGKRRRRGMGSDRMEACWSAIVWGTPLALILAAWLRGMIGAEAPLVAGFWLSLAALLVVGIARPRLMGQTALRTAVFGALAVTGVVHAIANMPVAAGVLAIDVALIVGPLVAWIAMPPFSRAAEGIDSRVSA
jgi:uncharacterized iron-regulated membrane protein